MRVEKLNPRSLLERGPAPQGEEFSDYVRKVREFRGMSKAHPAAAARVAYTTIHRIEKGDTVGQKMRAGVLARMAAALKIPTEYLRAATQGRAFPHEFTDSKVCPTCWAPSAPVEERWGMIDAKFCLFCGNKLICSCSRCNEPIHLSARFCPQCGLDYQKLTSNKTP